MLRQSLFGAALLVSSVAPLFAQASYQAPNEADVPNPYKTITGWAQLPDGRKWGSTAGVSVGPDGNIWAYDRCGVNDCETSDLDPVLEFDHKTGKTLEHFGKGQIVNPHGLYVDKQGNVWITDYRASKDKTRGLQVIKFSPDGKILMTLGTKGTAGMGHDTFGAPTDVVVAANGDIFVTDGHPGCNCDNSRVVKFDKNGKYLMEFGKKGTGPGELDGPHTIAMDSKGLLYVGDRTNNRIEIFDQRGTFIREWKQFGRPTGIYIAPGDIIYVTDTESQSEKADGFGYNPGVHRGLRIGRIKDGKVTAFIPAPDSKGQTSFADAIAVDHDGNVYGAEVGPKDLKKYVKIM